MTTRTALLLAIAPLALAACSQGQPDPASSAGAEATALPDPVAPSDAMPAEEPTTDSSMMPDEAEASAIPTASQGRWGLVPDDCTSTRGDAKGLMIVSEQSIKFYESRATLGAVKESSPTRIRATFAYEGEGMQWTRDLSMDVQDGGKSLVRREYGEDALPGPLRYSRCSA